MSQILVVYYSRYGSVSRMAQQIALGVEAVTGCSAIVRCVPDVSPNHQQTEAPVPDDGPPYASMDDLKNCDGLLIGSPSYFGNMAAPLNYFLDQSSQVWLSGALIGKPAGVFTATSSHHGGQESLLISMMIPLMHHGMIISGIPYSEPALQQTSSGGTPYGASHISGRDGQKLTTDESDICKALGRQIAELSIKLA